MKIIHKKQAYKRNYTLRLNRNGELIVTTGRLFTSGMVSRILIKHQEWINKRYNSYLQMIKNKIDLLNRYDISILGITYSVKLEESKNKKILILVKENLIVIKSKNIDTIPRSDILNSFYNYLRRVAKEIIGSRVIYYSKLTGFKFSNFRIKDTHSKWGSCSSHKNLNFNWKLILTTPEILDYVVIHELCHLIELNHSDRFWKLVGIYCKDYKKHRLWLRKNGDKIMNLI